jgi:8-oxo-dGTP pyrophosphatase MutT (NUDIX family)
MSKKGCLFKLVGFWAVSLILLPRLGHALQQLAWRILRPVTIGVRVLMEQDGRVVLVWHSYEELWYLPGGGVKRKETLEAALRREAREELGAELGQLRLLGAYTNFGEYKSDHTLIFVCHDFTLTGATGREIERFGLFDMDALPEDVSPATRRRIEEYRTGNLVPYVGMW